MPNTTSKKSPLIIGHRGAAAVAPENTLVAFKQALADGAAGVELDVRLSSDGIPVVIHDATLRRTGSGNGRVARMTAAELCQTNAGSWFKRDHPEISRSEYRRQFIPTLDQVFDLFNRNVHRAKLIYVEMKTDKAEATSAELAGSVVEIINTHGLRNRVVVVSFNLPTLIRIKNIDPSISTGALFEPRRHPVKTLRRHPIITAALDCGADQILLHRLVATRKLVSLALESNLRPVVWTVDDPKWMRRAENFGIHALITNNPAAMMAGRLV